MQSTLELLGEVRESAVATWCVSYAVVNPVFVERQVSQCSWIKGRRPAEELYESGCAEWGELEELARGGANVPEVFLSAKRKDIVGGPRRSAGEESEERGGRRLRAKH